MASVWEELGRGAHWCVVDQAAASLLVPTELRFEVLALFLPLPSDMEGPICRANMSSGKVWSSQGLCSGRCREAAEARLAV